MNWSGILVGILAFLIIGLFHPIVIKCEYFFTWHIWPVFLAGGLMCCIASLFVSSNILSGSLAILGVTMLWSIGELKEQAERVKKGWFPANPKLNNGKQPQNQGKK